MKITPKDIMVTFSDIHVSPTCGESICVRLERPTERGFDVAEYVLPACYLKKCMGFNEDEEYGLRQFVKNNSPMIWEIAREEGEIIADPV